MFVKNEKARRWVSIWLLVGVILVLGQIVIGGITRLTDSGLSMTDWNPIYGVLPPVNEAQWEAELEAYKKYAYQQHENFFGGEMTVAEFKRIYFWEYFHRMWARSIGIVFIIPFIFFVAKKWLTKRLMLRLGLVVLLGMLAASMGAIMVASGLAEEGTSAVQRTWVSAYKLVMHLGVAVILYTYLWKTYLLVRFPQSSTEYPIVPRRLSVSILVLLVIQILLGGLMAGMRAAMIHPHFPFFVEGASFLNKLTQEAINVDNLVDYERTTAIKAWVQVIHRFFAYLLTISILYYFLRIRKVATSTSLIKGNYVMLILLIIQFLLGVFTVINSTFKVPVHLGVLHQGVAFLLLGSLIYVSHIMNKNKT